MIEIYKKITSAIKNNITSYLVSLIEQDGKARSVKDSKMLVYENGDSFGTIGGKEIENIVIKEILKNKPLKIIQKEYLLSENKKTPLKSKIIIEPLINPDKLYIIGRGRTALILSSLAVKAGFSVILIDDNGEWDKKIDNSKPVQTIVSDYKNIAKHINFSGNAYIVIMTHNPHTDEEVLKNVICEKTKYIGMIGNENKKSKIFADLKKDNISDELLSKLHSPIGLKIDSKNSFEIAISILGELIEVKNKK